MIYQKSNFYHVFNRGCNKEAIFFNDSDYSKLLSKMKITNSSYNIEIIAYCLTPNHYHFLLFQAGLRPVSDWLKSLFSGYVQYINRKYARSGTLFERSAKPKLISENAYLQRVCHYVHANALKHRFVSDLKVWKYSSLNFYLNNDFSFISDRLINLFYPTKSYELDFNLYIENSSFDDELKF
jgi:REP-associated tyrosine transposase